MNEKELIRVAVISDALDQRNGVGTYYADLTDHLRDHVERIELYCPSLDDAPDHQWFTVPLPGDPSQRVGIPKIRTLYRKLKALKPHIVIIPIPGPYGIIGGWLARRLGAKVCIGFHTDYASIVDIYWRPAIAGFINTFLNRIHEFFFRMGDIVATLNYDMKACAEENGAKDVRIVGTPICKKLLDEPPAAPERLDKFLALGRLAPEKNLGAYLDAAREIPDATFAIGGDGPLRGEVERSAAEYSNIDYKGWLTRDKVVSTIDDSHMLVLASVVEGFGTVIVESLARRRLVIASASCGIVDWKDLADSIFRIQPGETVAQAIRRARAESPEELVRRAEQGRAAVLTLNDRAINDWMDVFHSLVSTNTAPERMRKAA